MSSSRWTLQQGQDFLLALEPKLQQIGWTGKIVGGVAMRGFSSHDLDILLQPVKRNARDFVEIDTLVQRMFPEAYSAELSPAETKQWNCAPETWVADLPTGQTVEFFIRLETVREGVTRVQSLLLEIRRKRGEEHFDAREYLLQKPRETHHWAVRVEWMPGHGYTEVLSTTTAEATEFDIATEAAHRHVISPEDIQWVKQVREISPKEARLFRSRGRRS